jgi:hypothetical protein
MDFHSISTISPVLILYTKKLVGTFCVICDILYYVRSHTQKEHFSCIVWCQRGSVHVPVQFPNTVWLVVKSFNYIGSKQPEL